MRTYKERFQILSLYEGGLNKSRISKETGISRSTIRDIIKKYNGTVSELVYELDLKSSALRACGFESHQCYHYSYILGLYLGDGCISKHPRTYILRIALDDKYPEIQKRCKNSLQILFPDNRVGVVRSSGCSYIYVYSKKLPSLFPQHDKGKKHLRKIALEQWQKDIILENPKQFFLGLLHSDGCHYFRCEKFCYGFANKSKDINDLFIWICKNLNIDTNSHFNSNKKIYRTEIAKRGSVAIAQEIAGFKQ